MLNINNTKIVTKKPQIALVIVGPSSAGKTEIAYEIARQINGEVINMDRTFIFKYFPIASGLSDVLKEVGVKRHLYEILEPQEKIIDIKKYALMVNKTAQSIINRGKVPIIEGGSPKYFSGICDISGSRGVFYFPIGITYSQKAGLKAKFRKRLDKMFSMGLIAEVKSGLDRGYKNTKIMKEAKAIVPVVKYLEGKLTLSNAKKEIVSSALKLSNYQLGQFLKYPEIRWIKNYSFKKTVDKILQLLQRHG